MEAMEERIPGTAIPWTNRYLKLIRDSYSIAIDTANVPDVLKSGYSERDILTIGEHLYRLTRLESAEKVFEKLYQDNPENVQALSLLVSILESNKKYGRGADLLEDWLDRNPGDAQAKIKLDYFRSKL